MYITSGKYLKRKISKVNSASTRETMARIRESLFAILEMDLKDAEVLDLFSGSGILGFEALSCGASKVVFVEKDKQAYKTILKNLDVLGLVEEVYLIDYKAYLKKETNAFDVIFLDPPYKMELGEILQSIKSSKVYHDDTLFVYEGLKPVEEALICKRYGNKFINIFKCNIIK